jgi:predicted aconitase
MSGWRKKQIMEKVMVTQKEVYFEYLDTLRESGITNMFGAAPYLQESFPELDRFEAKEIVIEWMSSFSERHRVVS